jgi:hypothetical protein
MYSAVSDQKSIQDTLHVVCYTRNMVYDDRPYMIMNKIKHSDTAKVVLHYEALFKEQIS